MTGRGIFVSTPRDVYKGEMLSGMYHGYGEMIYSNGSKYIGAWVHSKRSGRGIFTDDHGGMCASTFQLLA